MYPDIQDVKHVCGGVGYSFIYDRESFPSWFTHVDEHGTRERFWSRVREGDIVIDVGAACGSYTLPALARGAAHVYAFMPPQRDVPDDSIDLLMWSLGFNKWRGRCSIFPFGLWSEPGWLVVHEGPPPSDFYLPSCDKVPTRAMPVTALDLVEAIQGCERLDWVKIDVEGAEAEVLRGGRATIAKLHPRILVENHLFKDADIEAKVAAVLEPLGYYAVGRLPNACVAHTLWEPPPCH